MYSNKWKRNFLQLKQHGKKQNFSKNAINFKNNCRTLNQIENIILKQLINLCVNHVFYC